ncbi:hypothetical protein F503_07007 [Ophiostoma piceae UAMH 11346]|uniref:Centromere protein H C-terminal domain-containing protein n=1 Tax=Ophiostoma piceae (strain UAMH 11346) TaxID=1262450 RepID=S3CBC6_OPHP1|nr:hypothetical protein F503_07007 [Ophiostoma piceae UAMH 11346]
MKKNTTSPIGVVGSDGRERRRCDDVSRVKCVPFSSFVLRLWRQGGCEVERPAAASVHSACIRRVELEITISQRPSRAVESMLHLDIRAAMTAEQTDTPMGDAPAALALSDDEARILALYDQLKTIQLEAALLRAREAHPGEATATVEAAQQSLLEARASYVLRTEVVDSVLTVHPVLRAVHQATQASPIERDLLAAVEQRDVRSQAVAREAAARHAADDERAAAAAACRQIETKNVELAADAGADGSGSGSGGHAPDDEPSELSQLRASVKASRQRWKLIKGAASAIVVGSGVDWARDAALLEIVLDPE